MSRIGRRHPRSRKLLGIIATAALGATMVAGVTTSSAATVNLIRNGDFETGIDGWSAEKGGTLEHSNDGFGDSEHSLAIVNRSEEHTSELQSRGHLVCRLLLAKKKGNVT